MAFWDDISKKIVTIAPALGMALGGPVGGIIGTLASRTLAEVLGVDPNDPEMVKQALGNMTPEQAVALRQADLRFAEKMRELDVDLERIASEDRNSARNREIQIKDVAPKAIATVIVLIYAFVQYHVLKGTIDDSMRELALRSLGTLDAALGLVLAYYFGSSASARQKDETLAHIAKMP